MGMAWTGGEWSKAMSSFHKQRSPEKNTRSKMRNLARKEVNIQRNEFYQKRFQSMSLEDQLRSLPKGGAKIEARIAARSS